MSALSPLIVIGLLMSNGTSMADHVIVAIGNRSIRYAEIACNRDVATAAPNWLNGRNTEQACEAEEQREFKRQVSTLLVEELIRQKGWVVPDQLVEQFKPPFLKNEVLFAEMEAKSRVIPEAVARVYKGEAFQEVYDDVVKPVGVSESAFHAEIAKFGSLEKVERYLARNHDELRRGFEGVARKRAEWAVVHEHLAASANRRGVAPEVVADEFMREMLQAVEVHVLDKRFELPRGREIFR